MEKRSEKSKLYLILLGVIVVILFLKNYSFETTGKQVSGGIKVESVCGGPYLQKGTSSDFHRPKLSDAAAQADLIQHCLLATLDASRRATNLCANVDLGFSDRICRVEGLHPSRTVPLIRQEKDSTYVSCEVWLEFFCADVGKYAKKVTDGKRAASVVKTN